MLPHQRNRPSDWPGTIQLQLVGATQIGVFEIDLLKGRVTPVAGHQSPAPARIPSAGWTTDRGTSRLVHDFELLAGSSGELIVDNPEAAILSHRSGGVVFMPRLPDLAGYGGSTPRILASCIGRGSELGVWSLINVIVPAEFQ